MELPATNKQGFHAQNLIIKKVQDDLNHSFYNNSYLQKGVIIKS